MKLRRQNNEFKVRSAQASVFDKKLAAYLAASAPLASLLTREAEAVVVSNSTVQSFGINGEVSIDFNSDGQTDFQIDHDRVNVGGVDLDYLQLDKNDISSAENPYAINPLAPFPTNGTQPNGDHYYITDAGFGDIGFYPKALTAGNEIGPASETWELFQETDGFGQDGRHIIHANRLIDEDAGQIDAANPNPPTWGDPPQPKTPFVPLGTPGWLGLNGETRYLGVKIDLNDSIEVGFNDDNDGPIAHYHGWIGVRITNEADATGEVVGWGYETVPNEPINAGELAAGLPGDYNSDGAVNAADYVVWQKTNGLPAGYNTWRTHFGESMPGFGGIGGASGVPEPGSLLLALTAGIAIIGSFLFRRIRCG
jgi:hypothetical protein